MPVNGIRNSGANIHTSNIPANRGSAPTKTIAIPIGDLSANPIPIRAAPAIIRRIRPVLPAMNFENFTLDLPSSGLVVLNVTYICELHFA